MNIAIVADGVPKPDRKMMGIFPYDQAKALASLGHNVFILSVNLRSFKYKRKHGFRKYIKDGITVYEFGLPIGAVPFKLFQLFSIRSLDYILKKLYNDVPNIDVVHSHFYGMTFTAAALKEKYGYKLVATEHYSGFLNSNYKNRDKLIKHATKAYKKVDKLIAVSSSLARILEKECSKKAVVVHNIADVSTFSPRQTIKKHEGVRFVSVGRLTYQKNYPLLISAFAKAHETRNDITLDIYGAGALEDELRELISNKNMNGIINLKGFADRKVISEAMLNSDAFILLSDYETFGVVYIEALASGIPIIATNCGGPEDFVTSDNGILVECGNLKQAVNAILYMCDNYNRYDPIKLSDEIKKKFSPKYIAEKIVEQYNF